MEVRKDINEDKKTLLNVELKHDEVISEDTAKELSNGKGDDEDE